MFILVTSGILLGGIGIYWLMSVLSFYPNLSDDDQINNTIRISIPFLGAIITAFSVILATHNTNAGEKSSKRAEILDLVKFMTTIIKEDEINKKSGEILKELESTLKSKKMKIDIIVNNGARFCFTYLNKNQNREDILSELDKLKYDKNSRYDIEKKELINLLNSNNLKDMRKLWILINYLSGKPAIKHRILSEEKEYTVSNEWIGKGLRKSKFYYDSILKEERNILRGLIQAHAQHDYQADEIKYEEVFRVCNSLFERNYDELGHFFRTTHRTLKLINQYYRDEPESYKMYIGLLRAQIPNNVAVLLFYNAFYTEPGRGMGREMIASSFYGNKNDFRFDKKSSRKFIKAQHFYEKERFLTNTNARICSTLLTEGKEGKEGKVAFRKLKKIYENQILQKIRRIYKSQKEIKFLIDETIEYDFSKEEHYLHNLFKLYFEKNSFSYPEPFTLFVLTKQNIKCYNKDVKKL